MKIKIFSIFHGRFPSEKAASLFAAKGAEAFAKIGIEVTLLVPRRIWRKRTDPYEYYNLEKNFKIVYLPTLDFFTVPLIRKIAFPISFLVFSFLCLLFLLFKAKKEDIVYSNESLPILFSTLYFPNTLYELHDFPEGSKFFYKRLFKRVRHLLVTNKWKAEKVVREFNVSDKKIILERSAVDIKEFDIPIKKAEARKKLGLPIEKKIAVYTGHLYSWKGADILAEAAKAIPEILVVFVGGTGPDIKRFKALFGSIGNIILAGYKDHAEVPYWQKAADVLILPNTAKEDISKFYTSPMKLFEYMASKRPIVATDIPSIREILNSENAIIIPPDDIDGLVSGIKKSLDSQELVNKVTVHAYRDVLNHTWEKRAKRIFDFLEKQGTFNGATI